jgi:predicted enzyme related to lactoylglutathione lyase
MGRDAGPVQLQDGVARSVIATDNIAVELMSPEGDSEMARRLRAALDDGGEGLKSIVFAVEDIERMHRRIERVGLEPEMIADGEAWRSFRARSERTHGVRVFFMQRETPMQATPMEAGGVSGLDHVVIQSADMERAAALYGARLGLDMRLDREVRGRRLMFFRCGDAIMEIAHNPSITDQRDRLWGLSWRVADADAARERLVRAGFNVSEVRSGMKPGTRVFTVRDRTGGVPTLMIETRPQRD